MEDNRLSLIEDLRNDITDIKGFFLKHEKDFVVRQYLGTGSAYAILLYKFPPKQVSKGTKNYTTTSFKAFVGNVQYQGLDENKKTANGCILDGRDANPDLVDGEVLKITAPDTKEYEYEFKSYHPHMFSVLSTSLDDINEFDVILLTGISAKTVQSTTYKDPRTFLNVQAIVPVKSIRVEDLYSSLSGLTTAGVKPCTLKYNPDNKIKPTYDDRYDTENAIVIDCKADDPASTIENGILAIPIISDNADNWKYKDKDPKPNDHARALIDYCVYTVIDGKKTRALVRVGYYPALLQDFQLVSKDSRPDPNSVKLWEKLGPVIFEYLDHRVLCQLDIQKTNEFYSQCSSITDSEYNGTFDYGLSLDPLILYADIHKTYKKIGIPVSHEWVKRSRGLRSIGDGSYRPARKVELVTNYNAYNLLGCNDGEFRVLVALDTFSELIPIIEELTNEIGDALMEFSKQGYTGSTPKFNVENLNVLTSALKGKRGKLLSETFFLSEIEKSSEVLEVKAQFLNGFGNLSNQKLLEYKDAAPINFDDDDEEELSLNEMENNVLEESEEEEEAEKKPKKKRKIKHNDSKEKKKRKYK